MHLCQDCFSSPSSGPCPRSSSIDRACRCLGLFSSLRCSLYLASCGRRALSIHLAALAVVARLSAFSIDEPLLVVIGRGPSSRSAAFDRHPSPTLGICRGPSSCGPFRHRRRHPPPTPCMHERPKNPWFAHPPPLSRIYRRPIRQSSLISPFTVSFPPPLFFILLASHLSSLRCGSWLLLLCCFCLLLFSRWMFFWFFCFLCSVSVAVSSVILASFSPLLPCLHLGRVTSPTSRRWPPFSCCPGTVPFPRRVVARDCCPPTAVAESCPPCSSWPKLLWAVLLSPVPFPHAVLLFFC